MAIFDIINYLEGHQMALVSRLVLANVHMVVITNVDNLDMKVTEIYKKICFVKIKLIAELSGGAVV